MSEAPRAGSSLLEVIVTLAFLAFVASVATPAIRRFTPPPPASPATIIADTLRHVIRTGRARTLTFTVNGSPVAATLRPDGSVVADTALHGPRIAPDDNHD